MGQIDRPRGRQTQSGNKCVNGDFDNDELSNDDFSNDSFSNDDFSNTTWMFPGFPHGNDSKQ
jgi:hypothetical protein